MLRNLWRFFNMKDFVDITSTGTPSSLVSQPLSSFMSLSSPLQSSPGCMPGVSRMAAVSTFPWRYLLITFNFTSLLAISLFLFWGVGCCTLIFLGQFFQSFTFVKCQVGFITGRQSSNCILNNKCTVTSHQQTLKELMWLATDHDTHLLFP